MKTSILEYLEESARKYPDKTAFADEHTSCTFKELEQTARRTGTALAKHFTPRNPVPVFMEKSVETIGVFMGAVYAVCWLIVSKTGAGGWVYIPGFFFGLGGSGTVAYKFYLSINRQQKKENKKKKNKVSFNRHL